MQHNPKDPAAHKHSGPHEFLVGDVRPLPKNHFDGIKIFVNVLFSIVKRFEEAGSL